MLRMRVRHSRSAQRSFTLGQLARVFSLLSFLLLLSTPHAETV